MHGQCMRVSNSNLVFVILLQNVILFSLCYVLHVTFHDTIMITSVVDGLQLVHDTIMMTSVIDWVFRFGYEQWLGH